MEGYRRAFSGQLKPGSPWLGRTQELPNWLTCLLNCVLIASFLCAHGRLLAQTSVTFSVGPIHPDVLLNGPISTIAVDPRNERHIVVASATGGMFSTSDGVTWAHEDSLRSDRVLAIAFLPDNSPDFTQRMVATASDEFETSGGGIWVSAGAHSWAKLSDDWVFPTASVCPPPHAAYDMAIAPDTHSIYVATSCGIAIGSPDGVSWRHIEIPHAWLLRAITALGNGHLIVAGQAGLWYSADETSWTMANIGTISNIHALSPDPRGGNRAYAVNDWKFLYETTDGGASWTRIPADPEASNCGGIAFAKAVLVGQQVRLYFSNRCHIHVTSFDSASEPTAGAPSWTLLNVSHIDTRDLAFHPGTSNPFLISTDGGMHTTMDGLNFSWMTRPINGLDADQITEVRGQYVGAGSQPDLYFSTQHNQAWGIRGSRSGNDCGDAWGLGVLRHVDTEASATITVGCSGRNDKAGSLFTNVSEWSDGPHEGTPELLAQDTYVRAFDGDPGHGLQLLPALDGSWRQIADIPEPLRDSPRLSAWPTNPTLIQAIQTGVSGDQQVVGLARVTGFSSGGMGTKRYAAMQSFGSLGVNPTDFSWYEVFAVDPSDPTHIIAADAQNNDVRVSNDGGESWNPIPELVDMVSHHGEYVMGKPAPLPGTGNDRTATLVSAISFCPDNPSRVLLGTQQGGAYFSFDGGQTWTRVNSSDGIVYTTSFFWLNGCGSAWASTYGRGVWQINMTLTVHRSQPCSSGGQLERLEQILCQYLHLPVPGPSPIRGLLVLDGWIRSINSIGNITTVTVSPGSVPVTAGDLPNLKIATSDLPGGPSQPLTLGLILSGDGGPYAPITGAAPIPLNLRVPGKTGPGLEQSPAAGKPLLNVVSARNVAGTPILAAGEPLLVRAGNLPQLTNLELRIDGKSVTKVDPSQKVFEYQDKVSQWRIGRHVVSLVANAQRGPEVLWVTDFLSPHDDDDKPHKTTSETTPAPAGSTILLPDRAFVGGTLTGVVLGPDDQPVPNTPVQIAEGGVSGTLSGEVIGEESPEKKSETPMTPPDGTKPDTGKPGFVDAGKQPPPFVNCGTSALANTAQQAGVQAQAGNNIPGVVRTDALGRFALCVSPETTKVTVNLPPQPGETKTAPVQIPTNNAAEGPVPQPPFPKPPEFVQPGQTFTLSGLFPKGGFEQNGKQGGVPVASAMGTVKDDWEAITTFKAPRTLQPGIVNWKLTDHAGKQTTFSSGVFEIVRAWLDRSKLHSNQGADFEYEVLVSPQTIPNGLCVDMSWTGPITMVQAPPTQVPVDASGHGKFGGKIRATQIAPGSSVPFDISAKFHSCK
jgi:hypothetical protein